MILTKYVLTLLDLSAAFDTIDHGILLNRMKHSFGIRDKTLMFYEYLEQFEQVVYVCGCQSYLSLLSYNVPQGSVLGPVMFILHTQPLSDVIDRHSGPHHLFVDDI